MTIDMTNEIIIEEQTLTLILRMIIIIKINKSFHALKYIENTIAQQTLTLLTTLHLVIIKNNVLKMKLH